MVFHRLDRISNMQFYDKPAKPIRDVEGYEAALIMKIAQLCRICIPMNRKEFSLSHQSALSTK